MWLKRLWRDQRGVVNTMDIILMATILVLGTIVGLVCLRNQVLQELSDTANAIGALNQGYSYTGRTITSGTFSASVNGSNYTDATNLDGNLSVSVAPAIRNTTPGEDF